MTDEQKADIIKQIKEEADKGRIVSVWKFVRGLNGFENTSKSKVAEIALEIKRDLKYNHDPSDGQHKIFLNHIKQKLSDRSPYLDWGIKGIISAIITTGLALLVALPKCQSDNQLNKRQDTLIHNLNQRVDSLSNLPIFHQRNVADTARGNHK